MLGSIRHERSHRGSAVLLNILYFASGRNTFVKFTKETTQGIYAEAERKDSFQWDKS